MILWVFQMTSPNENSLLDLQYYDNIYYRVGFHLAEMYFSPAIGRNTFLLGRDTQMFWVLHNKAVIIKSNLFSIIIMYITAQIPELNNYNFLSNNLKLDELLIWFRDLEFSWTAFYQPC